MSGHPCVAKGNSGGEDDQKVPKLDQEGKSVRKVDEKFDKKDWLFH